MRNWMFALAVLGLAGCDPRLYAKGGEGGRDDGSKPAAGAAGARDAGADKTESAPEPGFGGGMGAFSALAELSKNKEPGPFDDPKESREAKEGSYAPILDLKGELVELERPFSFSLSDLFSAGRDTVALRTLVRRLEKLAADEKVSAILVRLDGLRPSSAAAEELRAALVGLQKRTPIHCHLAAGDNLTMLLASACRSVTIAPLGSILLNGPAATPVYLKTLLDKLGIEADVIHVGAYKGAPEPLTRTEPSREMRETFDDILGGAYDRLTRLVAEGRRVEVAKVAGWIDQALFTAEQAKAAGLVDAVQPYEAWREATAPRHAWKKVPVGEQKKLDLLSLLGLRPRPRPHGPHVALLYAVGEVVNGKGGPTAAFTQIAPGRLVPALRAVAADPDVKAVVLRVDSPGGSAQASELIWQAARELHGNKPLVVSMGELAASGGYYISSAADHIFAQPDTLTGSIGVFSAKLVVGPGLEKLGVHFVELGKGKHAGIFSPVRRWSEDERKAMRETIENVYATFKARVAEGRGVAPEAVEPNAKGRVFTGAEAQKRGLVDELGGLDDALAYARRQAKLAPAAAVEVYPPEPTLLDFLGELGGGGVRASALETALTEAAAGAGALLGAATADRLLGTLRLAAHCADDPVRAVVFLPEIR
jgi:protease IV